MILSSLITSTHFTSSLVTTFFLLSVPVLLTLSVFAVLFLLTKSVVLFISTAVILSGLVLLTELDKILSFFSEDSILLETFLLFLVRVTLELDLNVISESSVDNELVSVILSLTWLERSILFEPGYIKEYLYFCSNIFQNLIVFE